ncbi:FAD-binding oxidoreductase [Sedimenticola selenatireducens]|mgnify:CR=1 FL=1|uniref:ferredoxin--NADP reductase n=1 Tax=Sedimenticola selenatireducens TaxID=191960 RepID=UPI002AAC0432|nr:FAD-binding oxidoreductase [Sedimenticola selenatireducens]
MVSPRHPVILKEKRELAPNTLELTYVREDEAAISYLPGQFFSIDFRHQGEEKSRSYSAAGRVADLKNNREFRFAITAVPNGAASNYFFNANPGDRAKMSGPFGALVLPRVDPVRYLLIGTGTGVAPYRAMLPELEQRMSRNPDLRVELVMGVRNPQELIYGTEFATLAKDYPGFSFHACYSRRMPETPQAYEHDGRVNSLFEQLGVDPQRDMAYLCGNPDMVDESAAWFMEREFSAKNLKREKYKFSTF